jgi:hypothetical protein
MPCKIVSLLKVWLVLLLPNIATVTPEQLPIHGAPSKMHQAYREEALLQLRKFHLNPSRLMGSMIRGDSYPFISGDGFRAACPHVLEMTDAETQIVPPLSCIFVKTDLLPEFFAKIRPTLAMPFVLITHNSDFSAPVNQPSLSKKKKFDKWERLQSDPLIVQWYAQNCYWRDYPTVSGHQKLRCIPIGLENRYNKVGNQLQIYRLMVQRRLVASQPAKQLLLAFEKTSPDRVVCSIVFFPHRTNSRSPLSLSRTLATEIHKGSSINPESATLLYFISFTLQ